jgi:Mg-chelatase subunit ChlD
METCGSLGIKMETCRESRGRFNSNRRLVPGLLSVLAAASLAFLPLLPSQAQSDKKVRPRMDLAFCIDTTGSMQGEIDMVKSKVKELVAKLGSGSPAPDIRVGLVAYRDRGDEYVTKVFPFSDDIDKVAKDISGLVANGGGDAPEAVNQGLHAALNDLKWDDNKKAAKLLFLIGDAGPHAYPNDYDWHQEARDAIARGIQINTIGCGGLESNTEWVGTWREIAKLADGKFDTLAYRQEVVDAHGRKETIVTAGGAAYRVAGSPGSWKKAAAMGKMEKIDTAAAAGYGGAVGVHGAMMSASMTRAAAAAPVNREENNLDEILLDAAKAKATKSLKVEY